MRLLRTMRMAWAALGANKLRSALTASGITIGIFSIISVMTAISALQSSIETGLSFLGSNIFQFSKYPIGIRVAGDERYRNRRNIDYGTYLKFARMMGDQAPIVCPKVWDNSTQGVFENRKTNPNIQLCGTNEGFLSANNFLLEDGKNLSREDIEFTRNVCVVGQQIIKRLFPQGSAIGKVIRINSKEYEVIGTLAEKGGGFGTNDDNIVLIPITKFFEIYRNDSIEGVFRSIAGNVRIGAFVISTIALIAAGVGIMNIMLVSVTERTKEIGMRKSVGARKFDIRMQFLFEALFLSLMGAIGGIVLGVVAGNGLAIWLRATTVFPWDWALVGVVFCSAIGIGFGLYPAHKAAALNPVEALRHE